MQKSILIETHYLPSLAYFSILQKSDLIILEKHENYIKQSFRNRCYINTSQGPQMLNIPLTAKHGKVLIKDIRIDHTQKWLDNHWRTIQTAYGKAAFFEHYAPDLQQELYKKFDFLYDYNYNLLSICLKWLDWSKEIHETSSYGLSTLTGLIDHRNAINVKSHESISRYYKPRIYNQVFGNMFVPDLSIIDLIFCMGPQANDFITCARKSD